MKHRVDLVRNNQARIGLPPQESFPFDRHFAFAALGPKPPGGVGRVVAFIVKAFRRFHQQLALVLFAERLQLQFVDTQ